MFLLGGETLQPHQLYALSENSVQVDLTPEAWQKIAASRAVVDQVVASGRVVYGINTGFGNFANVVIPSDKLSQLQVNLITSHASGVGNVLSVQRTRMLLALRINVLAKGFSGVSVGTVRQMLDALNLNCLSMVFEQGTVGASGDLAPLSHLALGLIGQGQMWNEQSQSYGEALEVLKKNGLEPIQLEPKEGLAMINGTQFITALGCEAVVRAEQCCVVADIVGSLTLEVLLGTHKAFTECIHLVRPHSGQLQSAKRIRQLLHGDNGTPSEINVSHASCGKVQDSYTLRCMPQVHGISYDTVQFVKQILTTECNSATDNPMIFSETGLSLSGGNFHGEYPAKACDYLAIGVHELASISERRIERLVNPVLSGLPSFLVHNGGLNSGFMIAHCAAASLVSENKVLCHPASVDSISTSASKEDHVSMGGFAARKALNVVEHVEKVLAIELICACQALEFLRPLKTSVALEKVYDLVRDAGIAEWKEDRYMAPDIDIAWKLIKSGKLCSLIE